MYSSLIGFIIPHYFTGNNSRAERERTRFDAQQNQIAVSSVDKFFTLPRRCHLDESILPDDGSYAYSVYRNISHSFSARLWAIIASYVHDTIPLTIHWNHRRYQTCVPCSLPDTGVYRWDLRQAVGRAIGVPQHLVGGCYCRKGYRHIRLLASGLSCQALCWSDDKAICWKERTTDRGNVIRSPPSEYDEVSPHSHEREYQGAQASTIVLDKDTGEHFALSVIHCLQNATKPVCEDTAFIYTVNHPDPIVFCTMGRQYLNLISVLKAVHETKYKPSLLVEFFCKDCAKPFHPKWIMADFFSYDGFFETRRAPCDPPYCGCYRQNRSWIRSVIARIVRAEKSRYPITGHRSYPITGFRLFS